MKSDLVFIKKDNIFTNSLIIAKKAKIQHESVVRLITKNLDDLREFGNIDFSDLKSGKRGRPTRVYLLNERQSTLVLTYLDNTEPVKLFKKNLVKAFFEMARYITSSQTAKQEFPYLTEAIKQIHENPKRYHFSNECNLINRVVLGMDAKKFKETNGLGKAKSIRPHLTPEQIEAIEKLQRADIGLLLAEPDYQKRKMMLEWYYDKINTSKKLIG